MHSYGYSNIYRRSICTVTTRNSPELYEEVYNAWVEVRKTLPADTVLHYTIQPVGTAAVQAGKDRGENIMGHESVPQCCMFTLHSLYIRF